LTLRSSSQSTDEIQMTTRDGVLVVLTIVSAFSCNVPLLAAATAPPPAGSREGVDYFNREFERVLKENNERPHPCVHKAGARAR
jgi:hypothetical protein